MAIKLNCAMVSKSQVGRSLKRLLLNVEYCGPAVAALAARSISNYSCRFDANGKGHARLTVAGRIRNRLPPHRGNR